VISAVLLCSFAHAQEPVWTRFTGDASADFQITNRFVVPVDDDPDFVEDGSDVTLPSGSAGTVTFWHPEGVQFSGWDLRTLHVEYNPRNDSLSMGIETFTLAGDADGDGDPGAYTLPDNPGADDFPDLRGSEMFAILLDVDEDKVPDWMIGLPASSAAGACAFTGLEDFGIYNFDQQQGLRFNCNPNSATQCVNGFCDPSTFTCTNPDPNGPLSYLSTIPIHSASGISCNNPVISPIDNLPLVVGESDQLFVFNAENGGPQQAQLVDEDACKAASCPPGDTGCHPGCGVVSLPKPDLEFVLFNFFSLLNEFRDGNELIPGEPFSLFMSVFSGSTEDLDIGDDWIDNTPEGFGSGTLREVQFNCFETLEDDCGVCRGGNLDKDDCGICFGENSAKDDCDVCFGENADKDDCGVCFGGNNDKDDCGICFGGNADKDDCDVCFGGNNDKDDCDVCFGGNNDKDDCDVCFGGNNDKDDCDVCFGGNNDKDDCDVCFGGNNDKDDCDICFGGNADKDDCGVCFGGNEDKDDCDVCFGGNNDKDDCDVCFGGNNDKDDCDVCFGGNADKDDCDICFGENAAKDLCDVCFGENACLNCDGSPGLPRVEYDDCGVCGGENCAMDACGICFGDNAAQDECGICFGPTNLDPQNFNMGVLDNCLRCPDDPGWDLSVEFIPGAGPQECWDCAGVIDGDAVWDEECQTCNEERVLLCPNEQFNCEEIDDKILLHWQTSLLENEIRDLFAAALKVPDQIEQCPPDFPYDEHLSAEDVKAFREGPLAAFAERFDELFVALDAAIRSTK